MGRDALPLSEPILAERERLYPKPLLVKCKGIGYWLADVFMLVIRFEFDLREAVVPSRVNLSESVA
jgi:hypothetical protein